MDEIEVLSSLISKSTDKATEKMINFFDQEQHNIHLHNEGINRSKIPTGTK